MKKSQLYIGISILPALLILAGSCEKPAGPGGRASIKGQVIEKVYDLEFRNLQSALPATDEDVFIKYGNDETHSDDRKTSPEGKFEFKYLSKGDYKIFVYSDDNTGTSESGRISIETSVNLSSKDQVADLGVIEIYKSIDIDDGYATISGQVLRVNYSRDFLSIIDTVFAQDLDVFLVYEDDPGYFDRVRTIYDGTFAFPNLIKGNYSVFVYQDDILGGVRGYPR